MYSTGLFWSVHPDEICFLKSPNLFRAQGPHVRGCRISFHTSHDRLVRPFLLLSATAGISVVLNLGVTTHLVGLDGPFTGISLLDSLRIRSFRNSTKVSYQVAMK